MLHDLDLSSPLMLGDAILHSRHGKSGRSGVQSCVKKKKAESGIFLNDIPFSSNTLLNDFHLNMDIRKLIGISNYPCSPFLY